MAQVYIGLGSNLENPQLQVEQAFTELSSISASQLISCSPLYSSRAVGPGDQPDYVNAVALLHTDLSPIELLDALQGIEQSHRRVRLEHWGPRTLDLDVLLFEDQIIDSERLQVPHPYLTQRNFVIYPLNDISPALILPSGTRLSDLAANCPIDGLKRLQS
ncbi:MAG: 2-amino-4-hydroxy-6-hydroxymethyldihydropteridine diphosphokinase [Sphingobacteriales bacterium]|nr:MAG: 2-amino-4-hydroxy-6-hydroxymethyldihydropteridine diphosphokinase [Sphingobacteriales bacterium]